MLYLDRISIMNLPLPCFTFVLLNANELAQKPVKWDGFDYYMVFVFVFSWLLTSAMLYKVIQPRLIRYLVLVIVFLIFLTLFLDYIIGIFGPPYVGG
ncbi:MAG: hypothetical protein Kow0075_15210 [Salibacteraceae bacterium]